VGSLLKKSVQVPVFDILKIREVILSLEFVVVDYAVEPDLAYEHILLIETQTLLTLLSGDEFVMLPGPPMKALRGAGSAPDKACSCCSTLNW